MAPFPDSLPEQMTHMLHTSLRIPRANRTVSDFLFRSLLDSPFHPAHPLPPASLSSSLSLHLTHTIDPVPNPLYPPATQHVPVPTEILADQPAPGIQVSDNHAIFIPVAAVAPYALGYALFHDPNHETICLRANPFSPPYAARFVFDSTTEDLLLVTHAGSPPSIGIRAFINNPHSACREQYMIAVPPVPYEWPHLPTAPLWMVSDIEFRQTTAPETPATDGISDARTAGLDPGHPLSNTSKLALLDAALDPDPVPSHNHELPTPASSLQPWPLAGANGLLVDAPAHALFSAACGGGVRPQVFASALQTMRHALAGLFYAPAMRLDLIPGQTSSFTGRSALEMRVAPPPLAAELRDRFAALYYLAVLPVSSDAPLIRPAAQRGVPALPGCAACSHRAENIKRFPVSAATVAALADHNTEAQPGDEDFLVALPEDADLPFIDASDGLDLLATIDATIAKPQPRPRGPADRAAPVLAADPAAVVASTIAKSRTRARAQTRARTLRPRPRGDETEATVLSASASRQDSATATGGAPACTCSDAGAGAGTGAAEAQVDAKTARERLLEARKKRNRLSAARSNEKRKARVAALENDVVVGRERVKELSERQQAAAAENARLKQLVSAAL